MPTENTPLTEKQKRFVKEYLISGSLSEAYEKAGYKCTGKTKFTAPTKMMKTPQVKKAIEEGRKRLEEKFEITEEKILKEIAAIAFGHVGKVANWTEDSMEAIPKEQMSEDDMKFLESIEKITFGDDVTKVSVKTMASQKLAALKTLTKLLGMDNKQDEQSRERANKEHRQDVLRRLSALYRKD